MPTVEINCPQCGAHYSLGEEMLGNKVQCAQCEAKFFIVEDAGVTVAEAPGPEPPVKRQKMAEEDAPAEWTMGDVILDLYEVKGVHEGGGMGLVYRVHHRGWNIDLAVKSPRAGYFQTEVQKENFSRECETWINLGLHPHVVSCHYVRALGGIPRVFAEYVEGGSLKEWIEDRKLYQGGPHEALQRILDIAIQTAWGLHYAHEHGEGLIHQDVKPANVLMMEDATAKITDFGLAKARRVAGESFIAGAGHSILVSTGGMTPAYCSPEQANKEPLSRKTDIWSWAVSVLEMFVGEVCWQSGTVAPELLKHLSEVRVEGLGIPDPPPELVKLLEQCFALEPGGRPENFRVVADCLKSIYQTIVGEPYPREYPEAAKIHADALNNRAISMLDLSRAVEAKKLFDQALAMDPGHPQATYNRGLHLWRNGRVTDDVLVKSLEESQINRPGDCHVPHLLGMIHLERWDAEGAMAALSAAEKLGGGPEIQQSLAIARGMEACGLKCLGTFERHKESVIAVALSADGRSALSGSHDKSMRLWDISGLLDRRRKMGASMAVCRVAGAKDTLDVQKRFDALLNAARKALSRDEFARAWTLAVEAKALAGYQFSTEALDIARQAGLRGARTGLRGGWCSQTSEAHTGHILSVALSANGRWALSGGWDKTLRLWEVSSGKCLRTFEGHTAKVESAALSADGRWALSGGGDHTVRLWEVSTGKCLRAFEGHRSWVPSVTLSGDGRWALSGSHDQTMRLWEVSTGKCLRAFEARAHVSSVALSVDGRWAASGNVDGYMRLWEVSSGKCLRTFGGHKDLVWSVTLSADGRWAVSGSDAVRLWEVSSGKCLRAFEGHTGWVKSVTLSADGRWALSAGWDETLRLWEVSSGKCLRAFKGHTDSVTSVALSADGRWALSAGGREIRLWELEWDYQFPENKDWDEGARPALKIFLSLRCAVDEDGFTRVGKPTWTEEDFQKLLIDLQYRGYGWLRPDGVKRELEKMVAAWR